MALTLITLGELTLADEEGNKIACPEKALLLLAYLCQKPSGEADRRAVANFLWSDSETEAADANLRSTLHRLKRCLAPGAGDVLCSEGMMLRRNASILRSDIDLREEASSGHRNLQLL